MLFFQSKPIIHIKTFMTAICSLTCSVRCLLTCFLPCFLTRYSPNKNTLSTAKNILTDILAETVNISHSSIIVFQSKLVIHLSGFSPHYLKHSASFRRFYRLFLNLLFIYHLRRFLIIWKKYEHIWLAQHLNRSHSHRHH